MGAVDLGWTGGLGLGTRRGAGRLSGGEWVLLGFPETSAHHGGRYLERLLVFAPGQPVPRFSIDLERDILGDFVLSFRDEGGGEILGRFDAPPDPESFKLRALAEAARRLDRSSGATDGSGPAPSVRN